MAGRRGAPPIPPYARKGRTVGNLVASRRNLDDPSGGFGGKEAGGVGRSRRPPKPAFWIGSGQETSSSAEGSRRGGQAGWALGSVGMLGGFGGLGDSSGSFLLGRSEEMELRWEWVTTWRAFFILLVSRNEFINQEELQ